MIKQKIYKSYSLGAVALIGLLLSSCSSVNPQTRIDKNPSIYEGLPTKHKELVKQRQLSEGMSKNAVFLAWGKADRETESFVDGKNSSTWYYTTLTPSYRQHISGGIILGSHYNHYPYDHSWHGSRYSSRRHSRRYHRGSLLYPTIGTSVVYSRSDVASVSFKNGKVVAWQKLR